MEVVFVRGERLDPRVFKVPIDRIRAGYYSDKYFTRYTEVLKKDNYHPRVLYQFFPRKDAVIVGIDEALAILKLCTGYFKDEDKAQSLFGELLVAERDLQNAVFDMNRENIEKINRRRWDLRESMNALWVDKFSEIEVKAIYDGEEAKDMEPIMTIEGDPIYFGYLETVLLGVIARGTSSATAVRRVVNAANGKQILYFSARFDHYWVQATDGYAAFKGGADVVSTDANADYWGEKGMGTVPHALIAAYHGSTSMAAIKFDEHVPAYVNRIILVDWDNDVIGTTKRMMIDFYEHITGKKYSPSANLDSVIGVGKGKIWGVRFDTSGTLRDASVTPINENSLGVCPELVWKARQEFDRMGMNNLKIVVSGGFNAEKISLFEKLKVPVDSYGIGSSLLREKIDITADIVEVDGKPCAKVGRQKGNLLRLERVNL
jgi:nicotinate phosphoribosyltransferase